MLLLACLQVLRSVDETGYQSRFMPLSLSPNRKKETDGTENNHMHKNSFQEHGFQELRCADKNPVLHARLQYCPSAIPNLFMQNIHSTATTRPFLTA